MHPASGSQYFIFLGSVMVNEQIVLALIAKFKVYYIFYIFYFYFFAIQTSYIMALNLLLDYTAYTHGLLRQCSRIPNWTSVGGTLPPSCVLKH